MYPYHTGYRVAPVPSPYPHPHHMYPSGPGVMLAPQMGMGMGPPPPPPPPIVHVHVSVPFPVPVPAYRPEPFFSRGGPAHPGYAACAASPAHPARARPKPHPRLAAPPASVPTLNESSHTVKGRRESAASASIERGRKRRLNVPWGHDNDETDASYHTARSSDTRRPAPLRVNSVDVECGNLSHPVGCRCQRESGIFDHNIEEYIAWQKGKKDNQPSGLVPPKEERTVRKHKSIQRMMSKLSSLGHNPSANS